MKVKFMSSPARTTPAPFFTVSMITIFTNCLLFFLCVSDRYPVSGQRILWLYAVPFPHSDTYHKLGQQSSEQVGSDEAIFNSVSSDSGVTSRNLMRIMPHDQFSSMPVIYQRPSYAPHITPLISRDYGYGSATRFSQLHSWPKPFYREMSHFNGGGSGYDDETVLVNRNVLKMPKRAVMGTRMDDDEADSGSSGSGSTEIDTSSIRRGEEFSHFNPFNFVRDDDDVKPVLPTVLMDNNISIRPRCPMEAGNDQVRFHTETSACYTLGTRGPCGNYMIFTASDNINGYCECDQGSFDRPLIRIGEQCHFLYTQAMCPSGYWLTLMTPNSFPDCQPNPCYLNTKKITKTFTKLVTSSKNFSVLFKGECVHLNSPSRHCRREGEVVLFPEGSTEPACGFPKSKRRLHRRQISNVIRFACRPGMRRHPITKKCMRSRAIVFS